MVTLILVILLTAFAFVESAAYSIYEIRINKNKAGGITLLLLSIVGFVFPVFAFLTS